MIDLTSIILATDEAATAALAEAQQPITVDPAEVERILATLPAKAAATVRDDPSAIAFTLWSGKGPTARAIADAVHDRIAACLGSGHAVDDAGTHCVYLPLSRVALAARDIRSNRWINEVRAAWKKRGGTVEPIHDGRVGAFVFASMADMHTVTIDLTRSPAEVVNEAATALRLPLWTLDGLGQAWAARVGHLGDEHIVFDLPGQYMPDGVYRSVPCIKFGQGDADPFAIDLDDARTLDAATLIARAADALGLTVAPKEAAPVNVPVTAQEPVKVAPVVNQGQANGNRPQGQGKPGQGGRR